MRLQIHDGKEIEVSENLFGQKFNETLVHQALVAYLAGGRSGTKAQKSRAEVRGGGIKPWRQKGTGRARAGSIRSPIWVGGGRAFAAKPRDYSQKLNKKMYRNAMRSILSELHRQNRLKVITSFGLDQAKTKIFCKALDNLVSSRDVLMILDNYDENVFLGARNVPRVEIALVKDVNPVNLVGHEHVVMTEGALQQIEEWLG